LKETESTMAKASAKADTGAEATTWLSLKDASDFLGVHFTTLRAWSDRGEVRVFRTPGGHRRFSADDLRRFLDDRASHTALATTEAPAAMVNAALYRVREELARSAAPHQHGWREEMRADPNGDRQQRGRQLLALALAYVMRPTQRDQIILEGRQLGVEYGHDAARHGISLAATGRAVQFFRAQLVETVRSRDNAGVMDADDQRMHQMIDHFLDEVLFAVLDGYEAQKSLDAAVEIGDSVS
jgi:excisionase family DNA binding protein